MPSARIRRRGAWAAFDTVYFFGGILAYVGGPMLLNVAAIRPSMAAILDSIWPPPRKRRTLSIALTAPLFLAALGCDRC